jgi:hypothetical protein
MALGILGRVRQLDIVRSTDPGIINLLLQVEVAKGWIWRAGNRLVG